MSTGGFEQPDVSPCTLTSPQLGFGGTTGTTWLLVVEKNSFSNPNLPFGAHSQPSELTVQVQSLPMQQIDSLDVKTLWSECIQLEREEKTRKLFQRALVLSPSPKVEIVLREVEKVLGREREREATVCSGTQSPYPSQLH